MKQEYEMMEGPDVMEPVSLSELDLQVVKAMKNMWDAMYPTHSVRNVDF